MEDVVRFVERLMQVDRFGGRIVCRDEHMILVFDLPSWGEGETRAVQARFPDCHVGFVANSNSLSGFIVTIQRLAQPRAHVWSALFVLAALGIAYSAAQLQRPVI